MKVLVIQNSETSAIGLFGEYLTRRRGAHLTVIRPEGIDEASTAGIDLIVALGSSRGAYEDLDWIHRERAFLRAAMAADIPMIGICFGAQLIATAIGGSSAPLGRGFTGWYENDVPADSVWHGPWLRWHGDAIALPEGADVLATSDGTIQAFQYGRALGVQFHPEAGEETLRNWIGLLSDERRMRLDVPALLAESLDRFERMSDERDRLFGTLLALVGL